MSDIVTWKDFKKKKPKKSWIGHYFVKYEPYKIFDVSESPRIYEAGYLQSINLFIYGNSAIPILVSHWIDVEDAPWKSVDIKPQTDDFYYVRYLT